jgi:hypothetical protein
VRPASVGGGDFKLGFVDGGAFGPGLVDGGDGAAS